MKYHNNGGTMKPVIGTSSANTGEQSPLKANNVIFEKEEHKTPGPKPISVKNVD